jgi:hypothetical protein
MEVCTGFLSKGRPRVVSVHSSTLSEGNVCSVYMSESTLVASQLSSPTMVCPLARGAACWPAALATMGGQYTSSA